MQHTYTKIIICHSSEIQIAPGSPAFPVAKSGKVFKPCPRL